MNNDNRSWACRQGRPWLCRPDMQNGCSKHADPEAFEAHRQQLLERKKRTGYLWSPYDFYTTAVNTIVGGLDPIEYVKRSVKRLFTRSALSDTMRGN